MTNNKETNMKRYVIMAIVVIAVVLFKVFTVDKTDVRRFNDKVVALVQESTPEFEAYEIQLGLYYDKETADLALMQAEAPRLVTLMQDCNAKLADIKVPNDDLCRAFHADDFWFVFSFTTNHRDGAATRCGHDEQAKRKGSQNKHALHLASRVPLTRSNDSARSAYVRCANLGRSGASWLASTRGSRC